MENNEMTPESVKAELKFAKEHHLYFSKHNVELLNEIEARDIAKELNIKVELRAMFLENKRAYYVMKFGEFADYFGITLVNKNDNYVYDPALEEEYGDD